MKICDTLARSEYGVHCVNLLTGNKLVFVLTGLIILSLFLSPAHAAEEEREVVACPNPAIAQLTMNPPVRVPSPLILQAQQFDAQYPELAEATGNVEITRADQQLSTEFLRYLPASKTAEIPGSLTYTDALISATAASGLFDFANGSGELSEVNFSLVGATANGSASDMFLENQNRSFLNNIDFSTCPGENPEWLLTAKELEFRHAEGIGIAKGAKLRFMNVPFLYLPWMSFPIDSRRKSGFLYPHASSANDNGFEIGMPYYWNIAPN